MLQDLRLGPKSPESPLIKEYSFNYTYEALYNLSHIP